MDIKTQLKDANTRLTTVTKEYYFKTTHTNDINNTSEKIIKQYL